MPFVKNVSFLRVFFYAALYFVSQITDYVSSEMLMFIY